MTAGWAALLLLAAASPATGQSAPATQPAARADDDRSARLAECILAVRQADNPTDAMGAYARGCSLDQKSVELQDAYLRRMLSFGLPQIAQYAARNLVTLDPGNGLAWGVLGFMHGKGGQLPQALACTLRAAEGLKDDPSILHNAGQLLAWYLAQEQRPQLTDAEKRLLERLGEELATKEPFAKAFQAVQSAYEARAAVTEQYRQRIAEADAAAAELHKQAVDIDRQMKDLSDQMDNRRDDISGLRRDLARLEANRDDQPLYRYLRLDLLDRVRQRQLEIDDLEVQHRAARRKGEGVLDEYRQKKAAADAVRTELERAVAKVTVEMRWDPPAVDGVVTPMSDRYPGPASRPAAPESPEALAGQRLELARLYLRHEMKDKAAEVLRGLLAQYPNTEAAREARALLADIQR